LRRKISRLANDIRVTSKLSRMIRWTIALATIGEPLSRLPAELARNGWKKPCWPLDECLKDAQEMKSFGRHLLESL
jgi:hypothetical protein